MEGKKWYQKVSNWLFIAALLVLIPILITNISIMFQANNEKDKVPNIFGYKPFIVLSGSMETEIRVGDMIITKMTDPKTLGKDDVIAFRDHENTVTTHRIIDVIEKDGKKYFVTKGDNNDSQDENLVELNDVEGIYITRIPGVGNIFNELAKPSTIIILILGITVIFVLLFQISNKKLKEQERKELLEYKNQQKEAKKQIENKQKEEKYKEKQDKYKKEKQDEYKKDQKLIKQQEFEEYKRKKQEEEQQNEYEKERQEFLEYKRMKEEEQKLKEQQEFEEYKRMKEQKEYEKERQEFLEYKRMMEEKRKSSNQQNFSKNTNPNKKQNYNKNAKRNNAHKYKNNKKHNNRA